MPTMSVRPARSGPTPVRPRPRRLAGVAANRNASGQPAHRPVAWPAGSTPPTTLRPDRRRGRDFAAIPPCPARPAPRLPHWTTTTAGYNGPGSGRRTATTSERPDHRRPGATAPRSPVIPGARLRECLDAPGVDLCHTRVQLGRKIPTGQMDIDHRRVDAAMAGKRGDRVQFPDHSGQVGNK